ncbi:carbohydrate ABC transporter permease [Leifsonia shinshuensis]|uniref:carbohydrate ABC transporter permease n=1 Tax=Leifsonia shinshuensis TaxID=150026 RepID=UPI001F513664|nr:carbohydrate ABC transporter permease [Leifsonia shinshuensis]MCI0157673.1 carbohydrate ABC transporter permease [Leifsonia shinshuensis]
MTTLARQTTPTVARRPRQTDDRGRWWRFSLLAVITAIVLVPLAAVVLLSLQPALGSAQTGATIENYLTVIASTDLGVWVTNSLIVTLATVVVSVLIAAPAGYVLSRGRGRLVGGFSLTLFVIQSLPVITAIIPLFILFAGLGLVDSLGGIVILYVGGSMSVAIWMMAAYFDSIPISLEEAAWMDGCSVFGSFWRVVLRNSLPGVLSTAIFAFLLAWNDYLVAVIFLRSDQNYTLPIGLQTFFQQNQTDWGPVMSVAVVMMIPPIVVFAVLNRYFSVGGIGGSLAGR